MVYKSLINNLGRAGLCRIAGALGHPTFSTSQYLRYKKFLYDKIEKHYSKMMHDGVKGIFRFCEENGTNADDTGKLNVEVSYDGTWMTRCHKSHNGINLVMEVNTGFITDLEILSNFCMSCAHMKKLNKAQFNMWKYEHQNCYQNFERNAGAMEKEIAVHLWGRSAANCHLRYTTFVSNSVPSTYKAMCALNEGQGPYNIPV